MTSQDKLYLENYVVLDCPSEELGTISWYSYASSRIKTIEDLSWFEHLSAKTQNILTYFVPLDDMQTLSKIGVMHSWYRNFQTSCSQTFPDPYQYTGMDSDLAIHYYGRSEGLESGHDVLQTAKKLDMTMEILLEKCISSTLKKVKDVVASYFNKDPKAIMQLSNEEGGLEDLIEDRTLNWMEKINAIITSGEKAVIAVGVGHLFGENGVLYQLFKTGYQVLSLKRDGVTKIVISEYMSISEMLAGEVSGDIEGEAGLLGIADEACVSAE